MLDDAVGTDEPGPDHGASVEPRKLGKQVIGGLLRQFRVAVEKQQHIRRDAPSSNVGPSAEAYVHAVVDHHHARVPD